MEGEEGGGIRLSKRIANGEVDYKEKSGTAWSHSYLNQKPWHPLSYPNQRRKWIAEQTDAQRLRRADEVAREFAQEQDFFRQTNLISKKDKEKVELMQAVSFMYVRPPGYNAESAKAAEMADESRKEQMNKSVDAPSSSMPPSAANLSEQKKKPRPKDVFGRPLPTEEEFEVLKNAPRLETGVPARVKPFGVEVRNVKCLRCGNYGHQSGDRECPLKDAIMPNEEMRLKRDDPLNAIIANTDPTEPLKWELKQKPGISPPRGGFKPDDPNQQIVAEDDIFDEYGGFLSMDNIPDLLTNISKKTKKSKKSKHKKQKQVHSESEASSDDGERKNKKKKVKVKKKKQDHAKSSSSDTSVSEGRGRSRHKSSYSSGDSDSDRNDRSRRANRKRSILPKDSDRPSHGRSKHSRQRHSFLSEGSGSDGYHRSYKNSSKHSDSSEDSDDGRDDQNTRNVQKHKRKLGTKHSHSYEDSSPAGYHASNKSRDERLFSMDDSNHQTQPNHGRQPKAKRSSHKHSSTTHCDSPKYNRNYDFDRYRGSQKSRVEHSYSSEDSDDKDDLSRRVKQKHRYTPMDSEHPGCDTGKMNRKKHGYSSKDSDPDGYQYRRNEKSRYEHSYSYSSDGSEHLEKHHKLRRSSHKRH